MGVEKVPFERAFDDFTFYLKSDSELYNAYQSSIAMMFYDAVLNAGINFPQLHDLANKGAKNFLDMLIQKRYGKM